MGGPLLRPAARGIILDDEDRVLLCRFEFPEEGVVVWATPGGGVEPGESPRHALRRELAEEIGLPVTGAPPHVWHQRVVAPGHAAGYDGIINGLAVPVRPGLSDALAQPVRHVAVLPGKPAVG